MKESMGQTNKDKIMEDQDFKSVWDELSPIDKESLELTENDVSDFLRAARSIENGLFDLESFEKSVEIDRKSRWDLQGDLKLQAEKRVVVGDALLKKGYRLRAAKETDRLKELGY